MVRTTRLGADGQLVEETFRDNYRKNPDLLKKSLKANGAYRLARFVDEKPLVNAQLKMYNDYTRNLTRTVGYNDEQVEKARAKYGNGYGIGEFSLTEPLESIYFKAYGCGFDGSPFPTKIGQGYVCPGCGLKMLSSPKMWPENCPICGRITPLGMVVRDGIYKR